MTYSTFLKTVLKLDCLSCVGMAALLVPGASALSALFGMPEELLRLAGLALIPIGLFIGWLGIRGQGPAALVGLVVIGNLGWVAASFAVAASLPAITAIGVAFVTAQALAVLSLALLEWRGLRQVSPSIA